MSEWIETKDRLPEENFDRLEFTSGKGQRTYEGLYQQGQFVTELPPDAEGGAITVWAPEGITLWRPMKSGRP